MIVIRDKESGMQVTVNNCSLQSVILSDCILMVSLFSDLEVEGGRPRLFREWFALRQLSTLFGFA